MNIILKRKNLLPLFKFSFLAVIMLMVMISSKAGASSEKVNICHLPSNDMEKMNDLYLPVSAAAAHIAHGDFAGSCEELLNPPVVNNPGPVL